MNNEKVTSRRYVAGKRSKDTRVVRIRTENNGLGVLKTMSVMALIALTFAVQLFFYFRFLLLFQSYIALAFVFSLIACVHVLSTDKNGQSKAMWVLFLLLGFSFGFIIYVLASVNVFFGRQRKRYSAIFLDSDKYIGISEKPHGEAVRLNCNYLQNAGNFQTFKYTDMRYFPSGARLFDDMLTRLESAKKFVFIEYFIIADGVLFNRIMDVLEWKILDGLEVCVIYDDLGSHRTLSRKAKKRMKSAGVKLMPFNRLMPWFSIGHNYRDHRKIVVIDGETAYTGGCNLADEYINEKRMHGYWKDAGIRLDGSAVDGFTLMFLRQWEFLTRKKPDYESYLNLNKSTKNQAAAVPYADGLEYERPVGKGVYLNIISGAKKKLYIMTPYFITEETVNEMLINKALEGVDVRLILPEIPDKKYVYSVTRSNAERLIEYGVKVYIMKNSFVHSKIMMSENEVAVSSVNIDLRSFYQQFECGVLTDDKTVLHSVEADFENTFPDCTFVTEKNKNFGHRVLTGFLRLFSPLM